MSYICGTGDPRPTACDTTRYFSICATARSSSPAPAGGRGEAAAAAEDRGGDRGLRRPRRSRAVRGWAAEGRIALAEREVEADDAAGAALVYGATGDAAADARVAEIGRAAGVLVNIVDNLDGQRLHHAGDRRPRPGHGGDRHRGRGAGAGAQDQGRGRGDAAGDARAADPDRAGVPRPGRGARFARRGGSFWTRFYFERGPRALEAGEDGGARRSSSRCWARARPRGVASCIWSAAGPGDPELLTLKARRLLHEADVVIHDRLVPPAILELARREAAIVEVGKIALRPVLEAGRHQRAPGAARGRRRDGGAAQGRRSGGLRAARRGGRGAGGGGHRLRRRPGHHRGQRRGGGDRPVADQARAQLGASAS